MLGLFLATFFSIPIFSLSERCMNQDKSCDIHGGNLILSQPSATGAECRQLCHDTNGCHVFTYFGRESFPFSEECMLFSACDDLNDCEDCLTAFTKGECTCGIAFEGFMNPENLIGLETDIQSEAACRNLCSSDSSCSTYTYYDTQHLTNKNLCMLLTTLQNPVKKCENCMSGSDVCEPFSTCRLGLWSWSNSTEFSADNFLLADESNEISYISGEDGCFKTIKAVAVGSGGKGLTKVCAGGSGGGSGYINHTEFILPSNTRASLHTNSGQDTILKLGEEMIIDAGNGLEGPECSDGGAGYSGGGGGSGTSGVSAGDGGTDGGDGEVGSSSNYIGGEGSGFDIRSISLKYYQLSPGRGGESQGVHGGGGGGVLVNGTGPVTPDGFGEGYGGGGLGGNHDGNLGCLVLEILD